MNILKFLKLFSPVLFSTILIGCSSYRAKSLKYQNELLAGNNEAALREIDRNRFLKKDRNQLLYYLEKGKLEYLNKNYTQSNFLLNQADVFLEDKHVSIGNKLVGILTNPENEVYYGEDFEKVVIHYYKALNYVFLHQPDEALVEVRKINLRLQKINHAYSPDKKNRYNTDTFALTLQGLLYEYAGETNNAFISYRNAVDVYLENQGSYFGVSCPEQLKKDLLRTAKNMGFTNEFLRYQKQFGEISGERSKPEGGELIVFWENGLVPYKDQTYYSFSILPGNEAGVLMIHNEELDILLPVPIDTGDEHGKDFSDIDIFNVAFPKYVERPPHYSSAIAKSNAVTYRFELTENYSTIAFSTLRDRAFREISKVALRLASKKISEYLLKGENEYLGAALGMFNALTEHADTRNWQTLPGSIQYVRIPLVKGENEIEIEFSDVHNNSSTKIIKVYGNGNIQFQKVVTLDSVMPSY